MAQEHLALDHIVLTVDPKAPALNVLSEAGFRRTPKPQSHVNQGTSAYYVFAENIYLEFAWVEDLAMLREAGPDLAARYTNPDPDKSPFGLGLRQTTPAALPFETQAYQAPWLDNGYTVQIAMDQPLHEPQVFVVPTPISWPEVRKENPSYKPLSSHDNGARRLTEILIYGPNLDKLSKSLTYLNEQLHVGINTSDTHLLELTFDEGIQGKVVDARPQMPLLIRY